MTNFHLTRIVEKEEKWFFPGWGAVHIASSLVASLKRFWIAPLILTIVISFQDTRVGEHFLVIFLVSALVAIIVSFLFSAIIYPFLQGVFQPVLTASHNGKEVAWIMLPLQQLLIWAVAIGVALTDYHPDFSPDNPILLFSALVSFHASFQLFAYSKRIWRKRQSVLSTQIPTLEYELATANIEGVPEGFIE